MGKAVIALTASTVALAGLAVHQAWRLGELRDAAILPPSAVPMDRAAAAAAPATPTAASRAESTAMGQPASAPGAAPALAANDPRARRAEQLARHGAGAREFLADYADATRRARLLADESNMRREILRPMRA